MRKFLSIAAVLTVAASSLAEGWLLKAPYEAKAKHTWKVIVNASVGGQEMEATMKQILTIDSKTDKEIKAKGNWAEIMVGGNEQSGDDTTWDITMNSNGSLTSVGAGADFARMLAPAAFVYPDKEVKAGDKWSFKYKPTKEAKDITMDYEVVEQTKVGDVDALKIKGKLTEDGPMKGNNIYWIAKDGRMLKFELDLTNWIVPMAGNTEFDAKIKGELVKGS
jgi:hypothetical protein